ncbi:NADH dehydrogenase subunit E [Clostridia bacterium]|nr:NADH dehydrogenase subunit E [Clostridia bacterium]
MEIIDKIIETYDDPAGSLISVLQDVQREYGWISADSVSLVSEKTGVPVSKIYGVATFYTQFRLSPVGKYEITLCSGTACHVNSSEQIGAALCETLNINYGETTKDGLFSLFEAACLGCCSLSPVMSVKNGENAEVFGGLTPQKAIAVINDFRKREAAL